MNYEPVIGLEVHVELNTKSKMFCSCSAEYFGKLPNTHTCPVCLGLPGALPYTNQEAIEKCLKIGIALNCQIADKSLFERKNYFYPDLPKGYQISQYRWPLCINGSIEVVSGDGTKKKIGINRAHQEEDTGKLTHQGGKTLIDFNRSGVPLVEIVTEPHFTNTDQIRDYGKKLQQIIRSLGVSNADMEKGDMRLEANISLRPVGQKELPSYRVELKNINSFKFMVLAVEYEIERQKKALAEGETLHQETRGWNEEKRKTYIQRSKEEANDYRYFPEPDLPLLILSQNTLSKIQKSLPELPEAKIKRLQNQYQLSQYDASLLCQDQDIANFFEETVRVYKKGEPKRVANWIIGEVLRRLNETQKPLSSVNILPTSLAQLLMLVDQGEITTASAKQIFEKMFTSGATAHQILSEINIKTLSEQKLEEIVENVIKANPKAVQDVLSGKNQALGFLIGQVQRQTQGLAHPGQITKLLNIKIKP